MGNSGSRKEKKNSNSSGSDSESSNSEAEAPKVLKVQKNLKTKSMKKLKSQLNEKTRELIKTNWDTAKTWNIGERIFRRMLMKEKSWKTVLEDIVKAKRKTKPEPKTEKNGWEIEAKRFEDFLGTVIFYL